MSLSVKIIDNATGEVLVDEPECAAVAGAVAKFGEYNVFGKTHDTRVTSFSYIRGNTETIYHLLTALQKTMVAIQTRHPRAEKIGQMIEALRKQGLITDKDLEHGD